MKPPEILSLLEEAAGTRMWVTTSHHAARVQPFGTHTRPRALCLCARRLQV